MTQHVSYLTKLDQFRNRHLDAEYFEHDERVRLALDEAANDGRDHFVVVYFPGYWLNGLFLNDELDGTEVGPYPTAQLAWLAAELEYPDHRDADHYSVKREAVAGVCLTTGLPVEECDHIPGPSVPVWDQMLGPIENSDLMKEKS